MKRRRYAIITFAILILIAGCVWLMRDPPGTQQAVTLAFVTTNGSPGQARFRVYNDSLQDVFLSWTVVEAKTATGWRVADARRPKGPKIVDSRKWMDLLISVPVQSTGWRLKIIYATESRGPDLLLSRVESCIERRSLSALGSVVFKGQSSAVAEVSP
jgi:hypothetical protein